MTYSAEDFSRAGDKYLGRSYSEMDCQAFVERCMRDVGLKMDLPGSNAWIREVMRNGWVGTPEECVRKFGSVPNGALLFILKQDGKEPAKYRGDGIGNASHIGIKTGRGDGAIHSSSSRGCVATSVFRDRTIPNGGWNRVGLYNKFTYGKTVDWHLTHGDQPGEPAGGGEAMGKGIVSASNGTTVNLRKAPATSAALIERVPVGTEVEIVGSQGEWKKVVANGMVGWMMAMFIDPGGDADAGVPAEPAEGAVTDPGGSVTITLTAAEAAAAWPALQSVCEQILKTVGRG